jgi:hypothetical protein
MNTQRLFFVVTVTAALCAYGLFLLSLDYLYSHWMASVWGSPMLDGLGAFL